ncbi:MAG: mandelate racemase [SAR324 cluster bacterium]|nr:mandelate racemase [SAR324 cluster bacterium]
MALIEKIELIHFTYDVEGLGPDAEGVLGYNPSAQTQLKSFVLRIRDSDGTVGEYCPMHSGKHPAVINQTIPLLPSLVGQDSLAREELYQHYKRRFRHLGGVGYSAIDICLWDLFGKKVDLPIAKLLGGYRWELPAYASTISGDRNGGLSEPEAYAEFAQQCSALGYRGFKMHCWSDGDPKAEIETIKAVARAVGGTMDLMTDPASSIRTYADALRVGRACDDHDFFWLEDPLADCGHAPQVHRMLRQQIKTPLLLTEHVRGLEAKTPWITEEASNFLRADPEYDLGITGVMKTAALAEAFGLDVELHSSGPAHRHCMSAIRNSNYYELALVHPRMANPLPKIFSCGYSDQLEAVSSNGCVPVPSGPGLGVMLDSDFLAHAEVGRQIFE